MAHKGVGMKQDWQTHAIGRHLLNLPADATVVESCSYNENPIEPLLAVRNQEGFDWLVEKRAAELRAIKHALHGSLFIERVGHAQGAVTLISWGDPEFDDMYRFDTYFRAGSSVLKYSGEVGSDRKGVALANRDRQAREWREISHGEIPEGIGFVVGDAILAANRFNFEKWSMSIKLANKPDVAFSVTAFATGRVEPGLRERAGGVLPALLGAVAGVAQLRNRARPVGPIEADEILVAGTQNGKRTYGFKWEAPGKENSLAEPNLNITLHVGESAYKTNKESFASDGEALELWDAVVDSIRLRPGAV